MSKFPFMPVEVADLMADTMHLTNGEFGSYMLMLCIGWMRDGKLPDSDDDLARVARCSAEEWPSMKERLMPFFDKEPIGFLTQKRQLKELAHVKAVREARKAAGRMGGRPINDLAKANGSGLVKQNGSKPKAPSPSLTSSLRSEDIQGGFEEFWKVYPNKLDKAKARKAWLRAVKDTAPQIIIDGAMRYRASEDGRKEKQFIKHPATWLNGECWENSYESKPISAQRNFEERTNVKQWGNT